MNILRFVNSKDIREYLEKTGYSFSSIEAAWIIYQCKHATIEEKHTEWNELIMSMPDCEIPERRGCDYYPSLHQMLKDYMNLQNKMIDVLKEADASAAYEVAINWDTSGWDRCGNTYSTYEKCLDEMKYNSYEGIKRYRIRKQWPRNMRLWTKQIFAEYNSELNLISINSERIRDEKENNLLRRSFDGFWFEFPVPFIKGDIVVNPEYPYDYCESPFVFSAIAGKSTAGNATDNNRKNGDTSDMTAYGTFISDDGSIYNEIMEDYMDLEYYRGPFTGKHVMLKALSSFRRGYIDEVDFVTAYNILKSKIQLENNIPIGYTPEKLEYMGLR